MSKRILLVDDSVFDVSLTLRALNACAVDHIIECAGDGADACRRLLERRYDGVILDIKMPRMDGFEFLRWMSSNNAYCAPVIVVSNSVLERDKQLASKLGALDYVEKCLDFAKFKAKIQAALHRQALC